MATILVQLLTLLALASSAASNSKPHILLVCLDDIGRTDTGIFGKSNIPMPNLVKLASEGAVLENLYTQPVCSPTRSSLMVGRYPFRMGMQHPWTVGNGMWGGIPLDLDILPNHLNKVGYESHAVGKWHCGAATWQHTPYFRGFKSYLGYLQAQGDYYKHNMGVPADFGETPDGLDFWDNDKPLFSAVGTYSLDLYDGRITKILNDYTKTHNTKQKQAEHPLFIYLAHQTVHIPLQSRNDEKARCGHLTVPARRKYCDMMVELDDSIGSMVTQYKKIGLWENTLVLLLTDNSGMVNFDPRSNGLPGPIASQGSNYPLRGSKTTLFDGGVRSLSFISGGAYPKEFAGQRYTGLAHVVDLSATVLAAAGVYPASREKLQLDGNDLLPLITKTGGVPRADVPINIIQGGKAYSAVRFGKYKVIAKDTLVPQAHGWFDENGNLKEESPEIGDLTLLFDLEQDVEERHDIAAEHPELVRYGLQLIESYARGGRYMEPQGPTVDVTKGPDTTAFDIRAIPQLHGNTWAPYMSTAEWKLRFKRQQIKEGVRGVHSDLSLQGEEDVYNSDDDSYMVTIKDIPTHF